MYDSLFLFFDWFFVSEGEAVQKREFLTFAILYYFELFSDVVAFERRGGRLSAFG